MDSKRAAEVLRSRRARPCGNDIHYPGNADYEQGQSCGGACHGGIIIDKASVLGAQALEAWAWVERTGCSVRPFGTGWAASFVGTVSGHRMYMSSSEPTPLAAVLDAMEKEEKGK